jgi:outer membrane protein
LLRNNEWTVSRDIRNLLRAVTTDVIRVQARIKSIKSSESALEATQTGYEVGTRNIVDVLQAQQRLYLSQFDYADSRYNYVRDLMLLRQSAGTLNAADVATLNAYSDPQQPVRRLNAVTNPAASTAPPQ